MNSPQDRPRWAGPYCAALAADGTKLTWDPLGRRRPPAGAARFVVRWRAPGFAHPRKRTFAAAAPAEAWARQIQVARVLHAACDAAGWPVLPTPPPAPPSTTPPPGAGGTDGVDAARSVNAAGDAETRSATDRALAHPPNVGYPNPFDGGYQNPFDAPGAEGVGWPRVEGRRTRGAHHQGEPAPMTPPMPPDAGDHEATGPNTLGPAIEEFIDHLLRTYLPTWEAQSPTGRSARWWVSQLTMLKTLLRYPDGDSRISRYGVRAGDGIHFSLLNHDDLDHAVIVRRTTNLRVMHQNEQRRARYERVQAAYETKLAAWEQGTGPRGRKPVPPQPPKQRPVFSPDGKSLVSPHAEKALRTAMSFVFDRAFDRGMFPPGPNTYRTWNPRGTGGRQATRRPPFRPVPKVTAEARSYPGLGFWVDLGDALAARGQRISPGLRAGERYRVLPLTWVQLAPRPGEGCRLRDNRLLDDGTALIAPEHGGHLKARPVGEVRKAPLSRLLRALLDEHVAAGLAGPDGTLFLSPRGAALDPTNFYEDYLRPALRDLCGDGGPWDTYPALTSADFYDLRKAGITTWIAYGADSQVAATWSGHTEYELLTSYRGVIDGHGRRRLWAGIDAMVEQALTDHPPRGDGALARRIRQWLDLSEPR